MLIREPSLEVDALLCTVSTACLVSAVVCVFLSTSSARTFHDGLSGMGIDLDLGSRGREDMVKCECLVLQKGGGGGEGGRRRGREGEGEGEGKGEGRHIAVPQ